MAPAASGSNVKTKPNPNPIATQSDDAKYKTKYRELKTKIGQVEEDNSKLQLRILKSKKAIQRLRLERAILYDRLQSTLSPTNPFLLHTTPHLSSLSLTQVQVQDPPSILAAAPGYPLADEAAPEVFLKKLDQVKLREVSKGEVFGSRANDGVLREQEKGKGKGKEEGSAEKGQTDTDEMQVDQLA